MKRVLKIIILLGLCLILLPMVVPVFVPWSPINCRYEEINIKTGQARYLRYVWYVCVYKKVADTPLSVALQGKEINVADIEPWHLANTFSPGMHYSPHHRFHSALHQAREAKSVFEMADASPDRKREIATQILTLWQQTGNYHEVDEYINGLEKKIR